jgi:beta-lactam-binding protein with PASTA domain
MKVRFPFSKSGLVGVLANALLAVATLVFISIVYFYVYLPNSTHHGESITVPDLKGRALEDLGSFLAEHDLRFEVSDSAYSSQLPPLCVLLQFPKPGAKVKENRVIYVTINQVNPPTVPLRELVDRSRINAEVVLKSNELVRGEVILEPDPLLNIVKEMRYQGNPIKAGTRVPKGAVIDIVVGDGSGPADFTIGSLIGDDVELAKFKLAGWNLFLGSVQIPDGIDTTGLEPVVYKQYPQRGDSVRVGDPVDLWVAPKGYKEPDELEENEN